MNILDECRVANISHAQNKTARPWDAGYEEAVLLAAAAHAERVGGFDGQVAARYLRRTVERAKCR